MKITSSKNDPKLKTPVMAADEDDPFADMGFDEDVEDADMEIEDDAEAAADSIDDMADTLDDLNDALQGIEEDDVDIETNNNIADHYIAECDRCHNVFITSVIVSDQEVEKISGECPVCDEESDQYLKWVIKDVKVLDEQ